MNHEKVYAKITLEESKKLLTFLEHLYKDIKIMMDDSILFLEQYDPSDNVFESREDMARLTCSILLGKFMLYGFKDTLPSYVQDLIGPSGEQHDIEKICNTLLAMVEVMEKVSKKAGISKSEVQDFITREK